VQQQATFLSYNPTGLNNAKCDWINSLSEVTGSTYIAIQEHFRKSKVTDKFFKERFPAYNAFVIEGFREQLQSKGRPKAGLAQLSRADIAIRKDRVLIENKRIQAQILNFSSSRLLWINAYFPTDPGTMNFDDGELMKVLTDLEHILDSAQFDDVLIAADMNYDMSRNSGFAIAVRAFLQRLGLHSVWETFPIDYTHSHTDNASFSTIDHFICNERLLGLVLDCGPLHLGDNLSRHSPILLKLDMGKLPTKIKVNECKPMRPAWYKATEKQQMEFKTDLDERLKKVVVPGCMLCTDLYCGLKEHTEERDGYMLDLMGALIEASHATIPMVGGKHGSSNHRSGCMPGWNDVIPPLKEASLLWHSIWMSAGRPCTGQLFDTMKFTRKKYKLAIMKLKQEANAIKADKLFEAAMWGGGNLFEELKKTRGGKYNPDLPENVDGANGEDEVCEKFKDVYKNLYNSAPSEVIIDRPDESELSEVKKVTGLAVKVAAMGLKKGRHDVSGSYGTDAIKSAPDAFFEHLAAVYRSWLTHGTVTRPLLACAFLPLLKSNLKNPGDSGSYRAIAGSATILMLFDKLILSLWGSRLASGSLQMGYKKDSSTAHCSFLVNEVSNHFIREGTHPILVILDLSMAFDKCWFSVLFKRASERLPIVVVRALAFVYTKQFAWVKWGTARSTLFDIANGTRQGSVLSPTLFSLYVQDLLDQLKQLGVGCHVRSLFVGAVAWADDFALLAPSHTAMKIMLDTASAFADQVGLVFSSHPTASKSKSKAIHMVGKVKGLAKPKQLMLAGKKLPWVAQATHLGHELHESGSMDLHVNKMRGALIGRYLDVQDAFGFASPNDVLAAIKLYCGDLYGGMLARLDSDPIRKLCNCWSRAIKTVWDLPLHTHTANTRFLSGGYTSVRHDLLMRWPRFYQSMLKGPSMEVAVVAAMAAADERSSTAANNRLIRDLTGVEARLVTPGQVRDAIMAEDALSEDELRSAWSLLWALQDRERARKAVVCHPDDNDIRKALRSAQQRISEVC
jgi:hypothetical protein